MTKHRLTVVVWFVLLLIGVRAAAWASDDEEELRVERVLAAGQIDSSTVDVGVLAVVVYGQGERHPVSGEWAKLDTARGYIKAVKRRSLILSLEQGRWPESIALERIQTLVLIGSPSLKSADRDNMAATGTTKEAAIVNPSDDWRSRFPRKYAAGCLSGATFAVIGLVIGLANDHCPDFKENELICIGNRPFWGMSTGYVLGTAFGVSRTDPHDRFMYTLAGSLLGLGAGLVSEKTVLLSFILSPPMATFASEWQRNSSKKPRISVNLMPDTRRHLSVVVTLRF